MAVVLSAQATDVGVNKATRKLYPVANTPQAILDLGVDGLKDYIKTIGLFNTKAENVIKTCAMLIERHNGEIPQTREELEKLPGVGRKTANVVLNTAKLPCMAVDTLSSAFQPHPHRPGKMCWKSKNGWFDWYPKSSARCSPLADSAAICLHCPQTQMQPVYCRPVRFPPVNARPTSGRPHNNERMHHEICPAGVFFLLLFPLAQSAELARTETVHRTGRTGRPEEIAIGYRKIVSPPSRGPETSAQ